MGAVLPQPSPPITPKPTGCWPCHFPEGSKSLNDHQIHLSNSRLHTAVISHHLHLMQRALVPIQGLTTWIFSHCSTVLIPLLVEGDTTLQPALESPHRVLPFFFPNPSPRSITSPKQTGYCLPMRAGHTQFRIGVELGSSC